MIVETAKHGSCTWNYDDEYCKNVTPDQVEQIIQRVSQIMVNAMLRESTAGSRVGK